MNTFDRPLLTWPEIPPEASDGPANVVVLAETYDPLYTAARRLPESGCPISMVFAEEEMASRVLAHMREHHLLLVAGRLTSGCCPARLIERLRWSGYRGCITLCANQLTLGVRLAYKAVSVDRCLQPPAEAQGSLLRVVEWLQGPAAPGVPGLTIFEA